MRLLNEIIGKILWFIEKQKRLYELRCLCSSQAMFHSAVTYCSESSWDIARMIEYIALTGDIPQENVKSLPSWEIFRVIEGAKFSKNLKNGMFTGGQYEKNI